MMVYWKVDGIICIPRDLEWALLSSSAWPVKIFPSHLYIEIQSVFILAPLVASGKLTAS